MWTWFELKPLTKSVPAQNSPAASLGKLPLQLNAESFNKFLLHEYIDKFDASKKSAVKLIHYDHKILSFLEF